MGNGPPLAETYTSGETFWLGKTGASGESPRRPMEGSLLDPADWRRLSRVLVPHQEPPVL